MYYKNKTYRNHSSTIRIGVPSLLVDLQAALGRQQPDERGNLAGQVVDLVGVLAGIVLTSQQGVVGEGFVFQHFDTFSAAGVVFGGLSNAE